MDADALEATVDQAIAACELMKAVSHAYARGRFKSCAG
jgi:hypothetical protein